MKKTTKKIIIKKIKPDYINEDIYDRKSLGDYQNPIRDNQFMCDVYKGFFYAALVALFVITLLYAMQGDQESLKAGLIH